MSNDTKAPTPSAAPSRRDALKAGIVQNHSGEDALGHHFDTGAAGDARLHAHPQTHDPA